MCGSCPSGSRGLRRADTSHPFFAVNIYMYSQCSSGIKAKRISLPCCQAAVWLSPCQGDRETMLHVSAHRICMHVLHLTPALVQLAPRTKRSPRMPTQRGVNAPAAARASVLGLPWGGDCSSGMGRLITSYLGCGPQIRGLFGVSPKGMRSVELLAHGFGAELVTE